MRGNARKMEYRRQADPQTLASLSTSAQPLAWTPNAVVVVTAAVALGIGVLAGLHRALLPR